MSRSTLKHPSDFITPLDINDLQGRVLHVPAPKHKSQEILFVYGHHSSLERWWGLIQDLNQYGAVTVPDLPGFGGMESFYKIGSRPTIDNLADYLASFVKLQYNRRRVTIIGFSFGFVVVTRMLQRCPDLAKKVDVLVSIAGFAHHDDFIFSQKRYWVYRLGSGFFARRLPSLVFKNIALNPGVLKLVYGHTHNAQEKFRNMTRKERKAMMKFEIHLWHSNDVRTHMATTNAFLRLDNCHQHIDLTVWHVMPQIDRYFDNHIVEQHMRVIFTDFQALPSKYKTHAPSVIADKKAAAGLIPRKLRQILAQP